MIKFSYNNVLWRQISFSDDEGGYFTVPYTFFEKRAGTDYRLDFRYLSIVDEGRTLRLGDEYGLWFEMPMAEVRKGAER
jgi:hypothetical protein